MCLCLYCLRKKKEEGEARKRLSARFSSPSKGRGGLARVPLPDPIRPRLPRYRRGLDLKSVILRVKEQRKGLIYSLWTLQIGIEYT